MRTTERSKQLSREREVIKEGDLRARIAELEGKLAEAEAVQAEAAEMAESALSVLDGDGELSLVGGYLGDIAALNSASPSAQALTRLVEAAGDVRDDYDPVEIEREPKSTQRLCAAVDAFRAARTGRGEGE